MWRTSPRLLGVIALILSALFSPAFAEKRMALVIGNSKYEHVGGLANPTNDAAAIAAALEGLGFTVQQLNDVGRNEFRDGLAEFSSASIGADIAVVYYAGHGMEMDRQNYLIPIDAKLEADLRVRFEAVALEDVLGALDGVRGIRIVILDACRNNPFLSRMRVTVASRVVSRGLSRVEPSVGTLVSFAAKEGTVAADGDARHSPYTSALLSHLDRPGVEINKLFRLVRDDVLALTGGAQEPYTYGSTSGQDLFLSPPLEGAPSPSPQTTAGDPIAMDYALAERIGSKAAWEAFLDRHGGNEDSFHVQLAEAALEKWAVGIFPPAEEPKPDSCQGGVVTRVEGEQRCLRAGDTFRDCPECPEMVVLPAGRFTMGSPASEEERGDDEGPQREVTIPEPFAVGKFEVTFAQWDSCVAGGGCDEYRPEDSGWGRGTRPVINVNWDDAKRYIEWLSGKTGLTYRLLSEAEWEYAARAGTTTPFSTGKTITTDQANFDGNYTYNGSRKGKFRQKTENVGSIAANAFGLHDMHGNVWEWVEDTYMDSYGREPSDGSAETSGDTLIRALRGGSWFDGPEILRSANRYPDVFGFRDFNIGFRVARTLAP